MVKGIIILMSLSGDNRRRNAFRLRINNHLFHIGISHLLFRQSFLSVSLSILALFLSLLFVYIYISHITIYMLLFVIVYVCCCLYTEYFLAERFWAHLIGLRIARRFCVQYAYFDIVVYGQGILCVIYAILAFSTIF